MALPRHVDPPGVRALDQLPARERARGVRENLDLVDATVEGELGEGAREEQVAGRDGHLAPGLGEDGRAPPAQGRGVEHVVVHERGRVHQLHGSGGPQGPLAVGPRGQEHAQRPQALAAGGDRRAGVLGQHLAVARGQHRQAGLEAAHQLRDVRAARLDDRLDGAHRLVPAWIAMMPPAVRIQEMSVRPAASSLPASSRGLGKRLTEFGR